MMDKKFRVILSATPENPEEREITQEIQMVYVKSESGFIILNNNNEDITDLVRIDEIFI